VQGFAKDWQSGSTAVVVLIVGTELLAANIGDSKAFICLPFQTSGDT
jgi:serine/threonine protein phosphatase PrpC